MKWGKSEYSVRNVSVIAFLFIMLVMFFGFYSFYSIGKNNSKNYTLFIEMNKRANRLPLILDKCELYANAYFNTGDVKILEDYKNLSREIDELLVKLGDLGKEGEELLVYFEKPENNQYYQQVLYYLDTLKTMNAYQQNLTEIISENIKKDENVYKQIEYLSRYLRQMDSNAKILINSHFIFTGAIFDSYYQESEKKGKRISIIVMLMAALGLLFIMDYLYRLMRNVKKLELAAKSLSARDWKIKDITKGRYREFNQVAFAFDEMKHAIIHYVDEMREKAKLKIQLEKEKSERAEKDRVLNKTKLLSLQMRMNPHFLFNTLNLIGSTAIHSDIELATELIEAISDILRYNLEFNEANVKLIEEINVLEKYIFIQKSRWRERIEFKIENNIGDQNIKIPPMLLQPIIENSIIHGLKDIVENGFISIEFYKKEEMIIAKISDNGKGISQIIKEQIYDDYETEKERKRKSIGLKNIRKRLEIIYKRKDLFKIPVVSVGTVIEISFPIERNINS